MDGKNEDMTWYYLQQEGCCKVGRTPPLHPEKFAKLLATKVFTNGADALFVAKKYADTFLEVMSGATNLTYSKLGWKTEELESMSKVFPFCHGLRQLDLQGNEIVTLVPGCFASLATLESLDLAKNKITELAAGCFDGLA